MAVLSSLRSSARLFTSCRLHFWELPVCKRITWLLLSAQPCYTSDTSISTVDQLSSGLERYKDLQELFSRRLKATYRKFSNTPDHSIFGHHHVYFIEDDGIYRMDKRQSEKKPEQVLNLRQFSKSVEEVGLKNEKRKLKIQWIVQRVRLSPQEKHIAATLKCHPMEELRCVVVRLGQRNLLPPDSQHIIMTLKKVFSFEWATDDVLFYTTLEGLSSSTVFRLDLSSSGSKITAVYRETQPDMFVEVALSRDQQILTINCNSRTSSEVLLSDLTTSHLEPVVVQPRQWDLLYHVEHWRKWLIVLANTGPGQEYQVVQAPLSEPSIHSWVSLFTPGPGTAVKDMEIVGDYCVLVARSPVNELILIVVPLTHPKESYIVQLPSWACAIETKKPGLADQQNEIELLISSPIHPPVSYCLSPKNGLLLSGTASTSEYQADYITTRLEACSQDGTLVPVTLFHAVPVEGLRHTPLLVHVYGAYGRDINMDFCPEKRLLLEQGWALAYCHIRGGGERGLSWQRQARVEGKQRGVEDVHACLHHLFSLGVSSPSLTALTACSAGGVPVGALCNRHPHMVQAVTLQAPFLNVLETMEDPNLPLTLEDRDEWGDPLGNPKHRHIISSYCPLHNITPQCYPSMLLTAYSGDARVPLTGVVKYTEQLKKAVHTHFSMNPKSESEREPNIVLNIQPGANHHGPEDFESILEEENFRYGRPLLVTTLVSFSYNSTSLNSHLVLTNHVSVEEALKLAFLYTELGLDHPHRPRKRKR